MTWVHVWCALLAALIGGVVMHSIGLVDEVIMPVRDMEITYEHLQRDGQRVEGSVVGIKPTSVFIDNQPISRLVVRYRQGGVEKKVAFEQAVPMIELPRIQPGMHVPLRMAPVPDGPVMIDLQRLDAPQG